MRPKVPLKNSSRISLWDLLETVVPRLVVHLVSRGLIKLVNIALIAPPSDWLSLSSFPLSLSLRWALNAKIFSISLYYSFGFDRSPPSHILLPGMCRNEAKACSILLVDKRFTAPKVSSCRFLTDRALRSETDAQFAHK